MVPIFRQDFTCPALLVVRSVPPPWISRTGAITHYGRPFQIVPLTRNANSYRLFPVRSPLLGNLRLISFLRLLRCFSSLVRLYWPIYSAWGYPCRWVSPFGHLGIKACLRAPHKGFSQAYTSFIAYDRQGIHQMHLFVFDPISLTIGFSNLSDLRLSTRIPSGSNVQPLIQSKTH